MLIEQIFGNEWKSSKKAAISAWEWLAKSGKAG
jgi:hypothetical protein